MAQTAAHLVDHVIPMCRCAGGVLSLPIPLRLLLAAQPKLMMLVLQVVHCVISRHLIGQPGLNANLNIDLHCLVMDGVYPRSAEGAPQFVDATAPANEALQAVLHWIIALTMKMHPSRSVGRRGWHP